MIRFVKNGATILALFIALTGCAAVPILNVKDAPVKTLSGKELTLEQVTKAIVLAGMGLKWEMDVAAPGHIIGTLNLRSHQAVVDITYNTKIYSITYQKQPKPIANLLERNDEADQTPGQGTLESLHSQKLQWLDRESR